MGREEASWTPLGRILRAEGWQGQGCAPATGWDPRPSPFLPQEEEGVSVSVCWRVGPLTRGRPRSQTAEVAASCPGAAGRTPAPSALSSACAGSPASSAFEGSAAGPAGTGGRWALARPGLGGTGQPTWTTGAPPSPSQARRATIGSRWPKHGDPPPMPGPEA